MNMSLSKSTSTYGGMGYKNGGNKKIYVGPNGGKYVMVRCDGKMKKRYLKKK
jgi:hypothetical protein